LDRRKTSFISQRRRCDGLSAVYRRPQIGEENCVTLLTVV
jgi:hypothetical protein